MSLSRYLFTLCLFVTFSIVAAPGYIGAPACKSCHLKEHQQWQGSHHDLAMQVANDKTVLGNFNNATFSKSSINTRFYKNKNQFNEEIKAGDVLHWTGPDRI